MGEARAASAIFLGPMRCDPSARVHLLMPLEPTLPLVAFFTRHELDREVRLAMCLGQVFLEQLSEFLAKRLILFAEVEIHAPSPYASATNPRAALSTR